MVLILNDLRLETIMLWLHTNDRLAIIIFEIQCGNVKKKKKSKISGT